MFITPAEIERRGSCPEGVKYAKEHFPNGMEVMDFLNKYGSDIPADVLQWGQSYLPLNDEEYAKGDELLHITNSKNVSYCQRVSNSEVVIESTSVSDSKYIFNSRIVKNSFHVVASSMIEQSDSVYLSKFVNGATDIVNSTNIKESDNILNSKYAIRCEDIMESELVTDCMQLHHCHNATNCYFSANLTGCHHCLFCYNLTDASYQIFNKPVSAEQFEMAIEQYKDLMADYSCHFMDPPPADTVFADTPRVHYDRRIWFEYLPEMFVEWMRTLPGYDGDLIYYITMLSEFWK